MLVDYFLVLASAISIPLLLGSLVLSTRFSPQAVLESEQ